MKKEKWEDFKQLWIYKYCFYPIMFFVLAAIGITVAGIVIVLKEISRMITWLKDQHKKRQIKRKEKRLIEIEVDQAIFEMEEETFRDFKKSLKKAAIRFINEL